MGYGFITNYYNAVTFFMQVLNILNSRRQRILVMLQSQYAPDLFIFESSLAMS